MDTAFVDYRPDLGRGPGAALCNFAARRPEPGPDPDVATRPRPLRNSPEGPRPRWASLHVSNVLAEFGAGGRTEAVAVAVARGLLSLDESTAG